MRSCLKKIRLHSLSTAHIQSLLHAIQIWCLRKQCFCLGWFSEFPGKCCCCFAVNLMIELIQCIGCPKPITWVCSQNIFSKYIFKLLVQTLLHICAMFHANIVLQTREIRLMTSTGVTAATTVMMFSSGQHRLWTVGMLSLLRFRY